MKSLIAALSCNGYSLTILYRMKGSLMFGSDRRDRTKLAMVPLMFVTRVGRDRDRVSPIGRGRFANMYGFQPRPVTLVIVAGSKIWSAGRSGMVQPSKLRSTLL